MVTIFTLIPLEVSQNQIKVGSNAVIKYKRWDTSHGYVLTICFRPIGTYCRDQGGHGKFQKVITYMAIVGCDSDCYHLL